MSVVINGITCGLTPTGFVRPTLNDLKLDLEAAFQTSFGQYINILPQSVIGQIIGIQAERYDYIWSALQDVYNSQYPDTSSGTSLDNVVALNDVHRLPATFTKVKNVNLTGTANAVIPLGSVAAVTGTGATFTLDASVTLDGSGNGVGNFTSSVTGPIQCPANTLTIIQQPVTGWSTVNNPTDGVAGTNIETDAALRIRRIAELENALAGPVEAIRKALLEVDGVTQVVGYENQYNVTDMNGRPAHSVQMYVLGGADQDIWQAIWDSKAGGAQAFGDQCGFAVSSLGQQEPICFSRLIQKNVYGIITVHTNLSFPGDGDTQLKENAVNYINSLIGGQELIVSPNLICTAEVAGLESVSFKVGFAPSPTLSNNLPAALNEILRSDTSLWTVVHI